MPNSIALAKIYTTMLDEVYKQASLSSVLDGAAELMREGYNADEIVIPMLDMQGLGKYTRNEGYVNGDVTLSWETVKTNFDRGRMFSVDELDNIETGGIAFGRLAGEFIRTKVVPELDAFRFSKYAEIVENKKVAQTFGDDATEVIQALRLCATSMDEDEVPYEERYLFITPTLIGKIQDLETYKSKEVLGRFAAIVPVPQTRFYTAITQFDGSTPGQEDGGYTKKEAKTADFTGDGTTTTFTVTDKPKVIQSVIVDGATKTAGTDYQYNASTGVITFTSAPANNKTVVAKYGEGKNINFLCVHKAAAIQFNKLVKPKIISPDQNQHADSWKYGYRLVSLCDAYENKLAGIYLNVAE